MSFEPMTTILKKGPLTRTERPWNNKLPRRLVIEPRLHAAREENMKRVLVATAATLALSTSAFAGPCTDRIAQLEKVISDAGSGPTNTNEPTTTGSVSATPSQTPKAGQAPGTVATPAMNETVGNKAASPGDVRAQTQGKPTAAQGGGDQSRQLSDALAAAKAADATGDAAGCGKALDEAQNYIRTE
jgi:hypothetical protein